MLELVKHMLEKTMSASKNAKMKDRNIMTSKHVTTVDDLLQCLDSVGGAAKPDRLFAATGLGEEVERFFDLLREGRNSGTLIVPTGTNSDIKRRNDEN
jgi:hypothetical protein